MAYTNTPLANEKLSFSQETIRENFETANDIMEIDHYPFNDLTANKGFHKITHWPAQSSIPAVGTTSQLFGYETTTPLGTLIYGQSTIAGSGNSPIIPLNSSATGITIGTTSQTTVIDVTGLSVFYATLTHGTVNIMGASIFGSHIISSSSNGATMGVAVVKSTGLSGISVTTDTSVSKLFIIKNTSTTNTFNNYFWTLNIHRAIV